MREEAVRQVLELEIDDHIREVGVYPAPPTEAEGRAPLGIPEGENIEYSAEMLVLIGLGRKCTEEPRITGVLPRGRARRLDVDTRILMLEDIPEPKLTRGPVVRARAREWVLDSRGEPAIMVLDRAGHDLVIWGERGAVRVFQVERTQSRAMAS